MDCGDLFLLSLNIRFVFHFAVTHLLLWHRKYREVSLLNR